MIFSDFLRFLPIFISQTDFVKDEIRDQDDSIIGIPASCHEAEQQVPVNISEMELIKNKKAHRSTIREDTFIKKFELLLDMELTPKKSSLKR